MTALPFLQFRLYRRMVVGIGARGGIAQNSRLGYLADEQHMAAQILRRNHLGRKHSIGILRDIPNTICHAGILCTVLKLIHIPARLHAEMSNHLKGYLIGQHGHYKLAGLFNQLPGIVPLLHRNRDTGGLCRHLNGGVGNTAIVFLAFGGENKQAIGQLVK